MYFVMRSAREHVAGEDRIEEGDGQGKRRKAR